MPYDLAGLEQIVGVHLEDIDGVRDALARETIEGLHRLSAGLPTTALDLRGHALERARADGRARITPHHLVETSASST